MNEKTAKSEVKATFIFSIAYAL